MGYYSRIDLYQLTVPLDKRAEVQNEIRAQRLGKRRAHWMAEYLVLKSDGVLKWRGDPCGKWKSNWDFIRNLEEWHCRGWVAFWSMERDGGQWAYELDGQGHSIECSARRVAALKASATRLARRNASRKSIHKRSGKLPPGRK